MDYHYDPLNHSDDIITLTSKWNIWRKKTNKKIGYVDRFIIL